MKNARFTSTYRIASDNSIKPKSFHEFNVEVEQYIIQVKLNFDTNMVDAFIDNLILSNANYSEIKAFNQESNYDISQDTKQEIADLSRLCSEAAKKVLGIFKFHLGLVQIKEFLLYFVKKDIQIAGKTFQLPTVLSGTISSHAHEPLNKKTYNKIQDSIDNGITTIVALRHLHRAKNENIPHYKWIDATIAAELAIKEVLCIKKPDLETLLEELPSPPLHKLYGPILKEYLGEESPFKNTIQKGAEIRNKLVHSYNRFNLNPQASIDYVENIEGAIFHLLRLLYPEDKVLRNACVIKTNKKLDFGQL